MRMTYLFGCVAGPHPVVHCYALGGYAAGMVFLVPLRADLVQVFFLIRQHHFVYRLHQMRRDGMRDGRDGEDCSKAGKQQTWGLF